METFEEAAERHQKGRYYWQDEKRKSFKEGAKWQAERIGLMEIELKHTKTLLTSCEKVLEDRDKQVERMYSEEDIKEAFKVNYTPFSATNTGDLEQDFRKWFEQFKKK
jgi:hypothetical protein